jgi:hypothetical protein
MEMRWGRLAVDLMDRLHFPIAAEEIDDGDGDDDDDDGTFAMLL